MIAVGLGVGLGVGLDSLRYSCTGRPGITNTRFIR